MGLSDFLPLDWKCPTSIRDYHSGHSICTVEWRGPNQVQIFSKNKLLHFPGWQKLCEAARGPRQKVWKISSPNMSYFVAILRFVAIYALFGRLWKTFLYYDELNLQLCAKNDELFAKIANSRLTKVLWPFQHSLKGCQLLPPWHFLLFASLLDWRLQVDMRKNLSHPLKGNCAMCFQAVLCNGLFEKMRLQGATFYLEGDQRLSGMWCFSYANTYIDIIIFLCEGSSL